MGWSKNRLEKELFRLSNDKLCSAYVFLMHSFDKNALQHVFILTMISLTNKCRKAFNQIS